MINQIKSQYVSDKFAMGMSLACVLHCFFVPSFLILTSGMLSVSLDNEFVHKLLVLVAVPISSFALIKDINTIRHPPFSPSVFLVWLLSSWQLS